MGFTPRQVDEMSLWEFVACCDGFSEAQGAKQRPDGGDIEDADLRALGVEGF